MKAPPQLGNRNETLFGRAERGRIEVGQPHNSLVLSGNDERGNLARKMRGQRFGQVTSRQALATGTARQVPELELGATLITDLGDVAANYSGQGTFGIYRDSGLSPFGFNGRFVYARLPYSL